jgi:hypothetical protein
MDPEAVYRMSGIENTYDGLVDALNAEAATLPAETCATESGTSAST